MADREKIIQKYIEGYNQFNIERMVADLDEDIAFENIQDGKVNMSLIGLTAFRQQAEKAVAYFTERKQTIKSFRHFDDSVEIEVDYNAVLSIDLPNGLKKGQKLKLSGKSIFVFSGASVIRLTDIS